MRYLFGVFLLMGSVCAPLGAADANPWAALAELRRALSQAPQRATFVQTYIPAGFSSGEEEKGWLAIRLPECLRWDYEPPDEKSFLLCGKEVYYWTEGEPRGQHYILESEEEPGLDFFLLTIEELRVRYNAASEEQPDGSLAIRLLPQRPSSEVVEAEVRLDAKHQRLEALTYKDMEGNLTRFRIADYRPTAESGLFVAPQDMEWERP